MLMDATDGSARSQLTIVAVVRGNAWPLGLAGIAIAISGFAILAWLEAQGRNLVEKLVAAPIALLLMLLPQCAAANPVEEIRAIIDGVVADVEAKNVDAVMSHYSKDAVIFDAAIPRQYAGPTGMAAWRKQYQDLLAGASGPIHIELSNLVVSADETLGYAHFIAHFSSTGAKGGGIDTTARQTDVFSKVDGQWVIVHEHISFPVDMSTGAADLTSRP
jgi:ketosteroid isomerase-like protein